MLLKLCVGDTIDAPRRSAFPRNKAALIAQPRGQQMFELAHSLLVEMADATGIESYIDAGRNPNKFCRGYGIFQRDLQFLKVIQTTFSISCGPTSTVASMKPSRS